MSVPVCTLKRKEYIASVVHEYTKIREHLLDRFTGAVPRRQKKNWIKRTRVYNKERKCIGYVAHVYSKMRENGLDKKQTCVRRREKMYWIRSTRMYLKERKRIRYEAHVLYLEERKCIGYVAHMSTKKRKNTKRIKFTRYVHRLSIC